MRARRKQKKKLTKDQERAMRERISSELMQRAEPIGAEEREGQTFTVIRLPEKKVPKRRSGKTRFHFKDVGKAGDV